MAEPEKRFDGLGEIRLMAEADGYVMCRRPGCFPLIMSRKAWDEMRPLPLVCTIAPACPHPIYCRRQYGCAGIGLPPSDA